MGLQGRVLLVNPWIYDFAAYNYWCEPLGLLSLGAVLRQAGYQVELIDCLAGRLAKSRSDGTGKFQKVIVPKPAALMKIPRRYGRYGIPITDFVQRLSGIKRPKVVLVTSLMTYWYPGVFTAIRLIRKRWSEVIIVLGGVYASLCTEHACRYSDADWVVRGEADGKIVEIIDKILESPSSPNASSSCRQGRSIQIEQPEIPDLDVLPMPAHELRWQGQRPAAYIGLETSRGCPYRCTYCASERLHPLFRRRSPTAVVEEITLYRREYGIKHFAFFDDALLVSRDDHFHPLMEEIIRRKLACSFHTPNGLHARQIDKDVARKMFQAGFRTIRLGLETVSSERQIQTGGKITNEEFIKAVERLKGAGFTAEHLAAYILIGLPDQTETELVEAVRFVHSYGVQVRLAEFTPIPCTEEGQKRFSDQGQAAEVDPLEHNNSFFPIVTQSDPWETIDRIKQLLREGNSRLF